MEKPYRLRKSKPRQELSTRKAVFHSATDEDGRGLAVPMNKMRGTTRRSKISMFIAGRPPKQEKLKCT